MQTDDRGRKYIGLWKPGWLVHQEPGPCAVKASHQAPHGSEQPGYAGGIEIGMTGGTIEAARKLLEHPIFGNEEHIKAVHFLEREEEATALRKKLKGQRVDCWCCGGSGELDCLVGCLELHPCNTCDGQPKLELREAILGKLTLGQLRDIAKGLGI